MKSLLLPLLALGATTVIASCQKTHGLGTSCIVTSDCDRSLVCDVYGDKTCHRLNETKPEPDYDAAPLPPPMDAALPADRKSGGSKADATATAEDDGAAADDAAPTDAKKGGKKTDATTDGTTTGADATSADAASDDAAADNDAASAIDSPVAPRTDAKAHD